jgi:hypothetical protein
MPKTIYCWRCKQDIPMLDEREWEQLGLQALTHRIQHHRRKDGSSLAESREFVEQEALDLYFKLTGFRETNVNALWHHRLGLYGAPCRTCG